MKQPKYTDLRYPRGYVPAARTNIAATFRRVRLEQQKAAEQAAKDEAERAEKLRPMKRAAK